MKILPASQRLVLAALFAMSTEMRAFAADWPEFRGPTGQGHSAEKGLPIEWGPDKNVAWKVSVAGSGWSSPVVVSGMVYLTTAVEADGGLSLRTLAMDAKTGRTAWDTEVFGPDKAKASRIHNKNSHASPTPLVADGRIYVHFGHQGTACLDTAGKVIWRQNGLRYSPVHGSGGSPALVGDLLVFSADGGEDPFIVALNKGSGKVVWRVDRKTDARSKFSFSTPLLISVNGQQQIISAGSGVVNALKPEDGTLIWSARYGEGYSVIPRPVFGHGMIFIGTGYDRPTVMGIRVDGRGDVTDSHVAWTLKKSAPNTPSLMLVGDELFMVSDGGIASCVNAKTGEVHWQERLGGNYSASPTHADGRIYFQSEEGVGTVLAAGKEFKQLAKNDLNERTLASPAIADGALFIRTAEHLYRIGKSK